MLYEGSHLYRKQEKNIFFIAPCQVKSYILRDQNVVFFHVFKQKNALYAILLARMAFLWYISNYFLPQTRKITGCRLLPSEHEPPRIILKTWNTESLLSNNHSRKSKLAVCENLFRCRFCSKNKKQTGLSLDNSRWEERTVRFRSSKIIKSVLTWHRGTINTDKEAETNEY